MEKILFQTIQQIFPNLKQYSMDGLKRLGIYNIRDLVFYKPVTYQVKNINPNLSQLEDGQLIQAEIVIDDVVVPTKRSQPIKIMASNDTGSILLLFFNKIPPFIFARLKKGTNHTITGKVQFFDYHYQISHPEFILKKQLETSLEPVYPLTYGLVNKQLYSYIVDALEILGKHYPKNEILESLNILHLHNVDFCSQLVYEKWDEAIRCLAEKELIANQLSLAYIRKQKHQKVGRSIPKNTYLQDTIIQKLGFCLTGAQKEAIKEIEKDQESPTQMMRLLQGDVGAGKTLVALMTIINVASFGYQSVLMVPTDLLANQHYQFFKEALSGTEITVSLLTGKTSSKERKQITSDLENGYIKILIGTHALFQEKINFKELVYIIIDEQHRFGVEQRLSLINKSNYPDVLVMTATPIPRSLTLTMFGDMDVSKLASKPENRLPIITSIISQNKIEEVILALDRKLYANEMVYWVCPLIEQEKVSDGAQKYADVNTRFLTLEKIYGNKVGILHGKMKPAEKDRIMTDFKGGKIQILVSTTVIEVGVDVPNATLMIIENAEKFGLAALHQLRGRVGRGTKQSHCILMYNPQKLSSVSKKRLEIMRTSNDGFFISEQDLILRGGGEILGLRQSGEPEFFFANLGRDIDMLIKANKLADEQIGNEKFNFLIKLFTRTGHEVINSRLPA